MNTDGKNMKQMEVRVDLRQDELAMLYRKYEEIMASYAWGNGIEPTGSGALWVMTNEKLPEGESISRASVIFAANRFVDQGIWGFNDATGKGGHHRVYFAKMTQPEMWKALAKTFIEKVAAASGLSREELLE